MPAMQVGAWSSTEFERAGPATSNLLFTVMLDMGVTWTESTERMFPDVFDVAWEEHVAKVAKVECAPRKDNLNLLGYFPDNELNWGGKYPAGNGCSRQYPEYCTSNSLLTWFLLDVRGKGGGAGAPSNTAKPSRAAGQTPGAAAATAWLQKRYNGSIASLNKAWNTTAASWDVLGKAAPYPLPATPQRISDEDAFLTVVADKYHSTTAGAIRAADPNHLIIGYRLYGRFSDDPAVDPSHEIYKPVAVSAGKHVDVLDYHSYSVHAPVAELKMLHDLSGGKPVMVSEFGFRAMDSGLPNTDGTGPIVDTQSERAAGFRGFITELVQQPHVVGYHVFAWVDEPASGNGWGENSNYGMVHSDDDEYAVLTAMYADVNRKVSRIHKTPPPSFPAWRYQGYDRFPALFFGAQNGSNTTMDPLEPASKLEWITKHQLAGYGWQHAIGRMQEEDSLHQVAKQTKAYAAAKGREVATFVYRDAQSADKEYVLAAAVLNDSTKEHWFLQQNGTVCVRHGQWPSQPQFNWSVAAARDWYIGAVIAEAAAEDGVDVVFFDETDWTFHKYPWQQFTNCPGFAPFKTAADWAGYREAKADLLARTVLALNAAGKIPLFSCSGGTTATTAAKCPNQAGEWPEEAYLATLRSKTKGKGVYHRFYESWMGFGCVDVDCWANWLENAIWETSQGLPFTIRWDMGMFGGSDDWLEFGMAAFLMAQGDYCYFGAAANWYDQDWSFKPQYSWVFGKPLGAAVREQAAAGSKEASYVWRRSFEHCNVSVNLEARHGTFEWRA